MRYGLLVESHIMHVEIEKCYYVDVSQFEIPVRTLGRLLLDGKGGIIERPVFEMLLIGVLHFHDELLTLLVLAIDVENSLAVGIDISYIFAIEILYVLDDLLLTE